MIPKIINYCWFGKNDLDEESRLCIESWKKIMPDYEIKRWDESNYDINKNMFVKEAYENKKWAFVSDYARLDIIYNCGGIYLDTDVEVIKPFDDLLINEGFMGFEIGNYVNTGLGFGAVAGHPFLKENIDAYNNIQLYSSNGKLNNVNCPIITTNLLKKYNILLNNKIQTIKGIKIYPTDYFCPMSFQTGEINITSNTYSIHRYNMSWVSKEEQKFHSIYQKLNKKLGKKIASFVIDLISIPFRIKRRIKRIIGKEK